MSDLSAGPLVAAVLLALLGGPAPLAAAEARDVVLTTVERAVEPAFAAATEAAAALATATATLAEAPTADHLAAARRTWAETKAAWERAEPLLLGPAWLRRYAIDFHPTRERTIRRALATDQPIDRSALADAGAASKGLPALDWLLFGTEAEPLLAAPRRLRYAASVAAVLHEDLAAMRDQWRAQDAAAGLALVASTGGMARTTASGQEALDGLVGALLDAAGRISDRQLEGPLGLHAKGPRPQQVESPHSTRGLRDLADNVRGILDGLRGGHRAEAAASASVIAMLEARRAGAGAAVEQAAEALLAEAEALADADLASLVVDDPERVAPLLAAARALRIELKTRATGLLGVTIYFGDSDGD